LARFLDVLTTTEITDKVFQVADHPFRYQADLLAAPGIITVPVGFQTDFASVPRFVPLIYALLGDTAHEPAVVHDWLYYSAITTKEISDKILLEAMGVLGVPAWRRYPIYWGVRLGGFVAWDAHRKARDGASDKPMKFPAA
jgi:hypothetical protein